MTEKIDFQTVDGREFDERESIQEEFDNELEDANDATTTRSLVITLLEKTNTLQMKLAELRYLKINKYFGKKRGPKHIFARSM